MPSPVSNNGKVVSFEEELVPSLKKGIRSEVVQEIISNRPDFVSQWGTLIFCAILFFIITTCWFIEYPDIIQAQAKLASINAPKQVVSILSGKLIKLNVQENQEVIKGQILGFIESTARHEDVLNLASDIDSIQILLNGSAPDQIDRYFHSEKSLGELQDSYQVFSQAYLSFSNYLKTGFYLKKRALLVKDKGNLMRLFKNLHDQQELHEQDLLLTQKTYEANEVLKRDSVISDFDYRLEQSKLIGKRLTLPQVKAAIINNESQQMEKEKEIIELENIIDQQELIFRQALRTFKSQVKEWKRKYTLTAPINGVVAFASFFQENQQLSVNQTICFINPKNSRYFAEVIIPQSNFGKVQLHQQVLLKFQSYPFQEYGSVVGKVEFISRIPTDSSGYLAKINLTNGLNTTFNKKVQYRDGLLANAEIVTQDMRLLERFYYNIMRQVKR